MVQGQFGDDALAFGGEGEQDLATVIAGALASHVAATLQTVDQFDRTVMLNLHAVRQFADARANSARHALDGEHQLILATFQPGGLHGLFAEMQVPANLVPELGQRLVVRQGQPLHAKIVSCPDSANELYREAIYNGSYRGLPGHARCAR